MQRVTQEVFNSSKEGGYGKERAENLTDCSLVGDSTGPHGRVTHVRAMATQGMQHWTFIHFKCGRWGKATGPQYTHACDCDRSSWWVLIFCETQHFKHFWMGVSDFGKDSIKASEAFFCLWSGRRDSIGTQSAAWCSKVTRYSGLWRVLLSSGVLSSFGNCFCLA